MAEITLILEGSGRRSQRSFSTVADTVQYLVSEGYTRVSGAPHYAPSVCTRLYRESRSGRYARINTLLSDPATWPMIVDEVAQIASEVRLWEQHYALEES